MDRHEVSAIIRSSGVVGIVRAASEEAALSTALKMLNAGLPAVEISLVTPGALNAINTARGQGIGIVGAGTILDEPSAYAAISAGAQFLVAPTLNEAVIRTALRHGVAVLPGVGSATEALRAIELGADFAKLFPASLYGPAAVRDLLVALPQIPLVPTGGVTLEDVPEYIAAGSAAVGLGSAVSNGDAATIAERIDNLLRTIQKSRGI